MHPLKGNCTPYGLFAPPFRVFFSLKKHPALKHNARWLGALFLLQGNLYSALKAEGHPPIGVNGHLFYRGQPEFLIKFGESI